MSETEHISIEVQSDFVDKQTRAKPVPALSELIWNALDADAARVSIELIYEDLAGGLSKILVNDNGRAFPRAKARDLFGNLGGSWKKITRITPDGRQIHGQEGKGRYKAFALGRAVTWHVTHVGSGETREFEVSLLASDLTDVAISPDRPSKRPPGVSVEITDLLHNFQVLESVDGFQALAETFALYLTNYPHVAVEIAGSRLDPKAAMIGDPTPIALPDIVDDFGSHQASVDIVEWRTQTKRSLYLCSEDGFPLETADIRFQAAGYSFSAYLKSSYIDLLQSEGRLGLAEMDGPLESAVEAARAAIKSHFRERAAQEARTLVDEWKAEKVYPFSGEPSDSVEKAERQIFEIVAAQVQHYAPEVGSGSQKSKALHLRMLRTAIERGPDELQIILQEVLDLPARKIHELASLLKEASLSSIITAAKTVGDRLKFIDALEAIVLDPQKKARLRERTQLHKILAQETWIFGEQYNLWVSDQGLRKVLERHRDKLDPSLVIDEPVKVYNQKTGIVDLMFSAASKRHRGDEVENLVVELKAPKVVIGSEEIVQITKYKMAVEGDDRFNRVKNARWHFIVISNDYDEYTAAQIASVDPDRRLIARGVNSTVTVKTWGEKIEENRARLQFFKDHLEHSVDEVESLRYLHEKHSELLKGVVDDSDFGDKTDVPET